MNGEIEELRNPEQWEEEGSIRPGVKSPRAVVSVSFPRGELERVSEEARRSGMKLSEYIRSAALDRARRSQSPNTVVRSLSSTQGVVSDYPQNRPRGSRVPGELRASVGELIRA